MSFPRAQIAVLVYYLWWIRLPCLVMFGFWIILQFTGVVLQITGMSNVSALAHLGGVVAGVFWWFFTRRMSQAGKS